MVAKSWGRAISGPILAGVGLILLILQQMITNSETATCAPKCGAWITLSIAAVMIFVSQYDVWKEEHAARLVAEPAENGAAVPVWSSILKSLTKAKQRR